MKNNKSTDLLLSIDLEDVRDQVNGGSQYKEGVPGNTHQYLKFFQEKNVRATFFVVGNVARKYPTLINEIISEGHEIACHSDQHVQINKQTPGEFIEDINKNLEALSNAGATDITGYRAPTFSLTAKTKWAYKILRKAGLKYSSSVLPAANPLYGWREFGADPKAVDGILEIPITLHKIPLLKVPMAGGVYLRIIPSFLINYSARQHMKKGTPITTYLHPYDVDTDQERFMHPDLDNKAYLNYLMYVNRSGVFSKLEKLIELCATTTYKDFYLSVVDNESLMATAVME